jgi:hypothetical protein
MQSVRDEQFPVLITSGLKLLCAQGGALVDVVIEIGNPYLTERDVDAA